MFERLKASAVREAALRIAPHIRRTPLLRSEPLSRVAGGDVYLKLENEQATGSFKLRGALNALGTLSASDRDCGVVASSAGNHGMGVAFAARTLGLRAKIYVPSTAPTVKKDGIRALGAELDDSAPDYDAAMDAAKAFGASHGMPYINPCLGDMLLAGQGTVALEILEELPALASLVVNVGGGGLLGGCASLVRRERPDVRIYGAQGEHTAAMTRSLEARRLVTIESVPTLADGLAGQIDDDALDIGVHALDGIATLTEQEIEEAIRWLNGAHGQKAEGAGACGAGAVLLGKLHPETPCAVVVSGGNIDPARWQSIVA
ncbi:MAG: pyridoxal-phosphate dependent enzyme [Gemmatimonadaceae bacterium]